MTTVKDMMTLARTTVLKTLPIASDDAAVMMLVKQGLAEIYSRFNISVKAENIHTYSNKNMYEMYADNVNMILGVYKSDGSMLNSSDVLDAKEPIYKIMSYNSFMLNRPENSSVIVVYSASPKDITEDSPLGIPMAMEGALLMYIGYLANTTITVNHTTKIESDIYMDRYQNAVNALILEGYKVELNFESYSIQHKGFV